MTLVLAGNYEQYQQWAQARQLSPAQARYVDTYEDLLVARHATVALVGQYWLHPCYPLMPYLPLDRYFVLRG